MKAKQAVKPLKLTLRKETYRNLSPARPRILDEQRLKFIHGGDDSLPTFDPTGPTVGDPP